MIAVIDYNAGNIRSVEKALVSLGYDVRVTSKADEIFKADKIVLPGVGAFGDAMRNLETFGLTEVIKEAVGRKVPFLGICLGMQLLFESSEESPGVKGLGVLPGRIIRFPDSFGLKIPHIGWNNLDINESSKLFKGIKNGTFVYFVHSYYLKADNPDHVAAACEYGVKFDASVETGNIYGCQFHPEKSGSEGLKILSNFASLEP